MPSNSAGAHLALTLALMQSLVAPSACMAVSLSTSATPTLAASSSSAPLLEAPSESSSSSAPLLARVGVTVSVRSDKDLEALGPAPTLFHHMHHFTHLKTVPAYMVNYLYVILLPAGGD